MESTTYGFDGQADEIGDVVAGHRYRHVVWLLGGLETMSIKKKQEFREFRSGLAKGERNRVALRFTKFVAELAEEVEVQLRVSPEQVRETVEWNSVGCYGGYRLRRSRIPTIFAESQQVSREEKCRNAPVAGGQDTVRFHNPTDNVIDEIRAAVLSVHDRIATEPNQT